MANGVGGSSGTSRASGVNNVSGKQKEIPENLAAAKDMLKSLGQGLKSKLGTSHDDGQGTLSDQSSNKERDDRHNSAGIFATTHPNEQRPTVTRVHQQGESAASGGDSNPETKEKGTTLGSDTGTSPDSISQVPGGSPLQTTNTKAAESVQHTTAKDELATTKANIKTALKTALNTTKTTTFFKTQDSQIADDLVTIYSTSATAFLPQFIEAFGEVLAEKGVAKAGVFHEFFDKQHGSFLGKTLSPLGGYSASMGDRFKDGFAHQLSHRSLGTSITPENILKQGGDKSCLDSLGTALTNLGKSLDFNIARNDPTWLPLIDDIATILSSDTHGNNGLNTLCNAVIASPNLARHFARTDIGNTIATHLETRLEALTNQLADVIPIGSLPDKFYETVQTAAALDILKPETGVSDLSTCVAARKNKQTTPSTREAGIYLRVTFPTMDTNFSAITTRTELEEATTHFYTELQTKATAALESIQTTADGTTELKDNLQLILTLFFHTATEDNHAISARLQQLQEDFTTKLETGIETPATLDATQWQTAADSLRELEKAFVDLYKPDEVDYEAQKTALTQLANTLMFRYFTQEAAQISVPPLQDVQNFDAKLSALDAVITGARNETTFSALFGYDAASPLHETYTAGLAQRNAAIEVKLAAQHGVLPTKMEVATAKLTDATRRLETALEQLYTALGSNTGDAATEATTRTETTTRTHNITGAGDDKNEKANRTVASAEAINAQTRDIQQLTRAYQDVRVELNTVIASIQDENTALNPDTITAADLTNKETALTTVLTTALGRFDTRGSADAAVDDIRATLTRDEATIHNAIKNSIQELAALGIAPRQEGESDADRLAYLDAASARLEEFLPETNVSERQALQASDPPRLEEDAATLEYIKYSTANVIAEVDQKFKTNPISNMANLSSDIDTRNEAIATLLLTTFELIAADAATTKASPEWEERDLTKRKELSQTALYTPEQMERATIRNHKTSLHTLQQEDAQNKLNIRVNTPSKHDDPNWKSQWEAISTSLRHTHEQLQRRIDANSTKDTELGNDLNTFGSIAKTLMTEYMLQEEARTVAMVSKINKIDNAPITLSDIQEATALASETPRFSETFSFMFGKDTPFARSNALLDARAVAKITDMRAYQIGLLEYVSLSVLGKLLDQITSPENSEKHTAFTNACKDAPPETVHSLKTFVLSKIAAHETDVATADSPQTIHPSTVTHEDIDDMKADWKTAIQFLSALQKSIATTKFRTAKSALTQQLDIIGKKLGKVDPTDISPWIYSAMQRPIVDGGSNAAILTKSATIIQEQAVYISRLTARYAECETKIKEILDGLKADQNISPQTFQERVREFASLLDNVVTEFNTQEIVRIPFRASNSASSNSESSPDVILVRELKEAILSAVKRAKKEGLASVQRTLTDIHKKNFSDATEELSKALSTFYKETGTQPATTAESKASAAKAANESDITTIYAAADSLNEQATQITRLTDLYKAAIDNVTPEATAIRQSAATSLDAFVKDGTPMPTFDTLRDGVLTAAGVPESSKADVRSALDTTAKGEIEAEIQARMDLHAALTAIEANTTSSLGAKKAAIDAAKALMQGGPANPAYAACDRLLADRLQGLQKEIYGVLAEDAGNN